MQSDRRSILRARVRLLRAIDKAIAELPEGWCFRNLRDRIAADRQAMLGYSLEYSGKVAYARADADRFNPKRRSALTLARYIRRNLAISVDDLPDHYLTRLSAKVTAEYTDHAPYIRFVTGDAIVTAYQEDNFGLGSCMEDTDFVQFYADNPEKVALLTYQNGCKGRALVWTTDQGDRILDRIYKPDNGPHIDAIVAFAKSKGIKYKDELTIHDLAQYTITMRHKSMFPYLDTFYRGTYKRDNRIVLRTTCGDVQLRETDGTDGNNTECSNCGERCDEESIHYVEGDGDYCDRCYERLFSYCEHCERDIPVDNFTTVNRLDRGGRQTEDCMCDDCASNNAANCDDCGETWMSEDLKHHNGDDLCPTCYDKKIAEEEELERQEELELETETE